MQGTPAGGRPAHQPSPPDDPVAGEVTAAVEVEVGAEADVDVEVDVEADVEVDVEVTADSEQMPSPAAVEELLAAASVRLGPADAAAMAQASSRLYSWARAIPGAATASAAVDGRLVGFGYGYSWTWESMTDAWSLRLFDRLGADAALLDGSFSIVLLVIAPDARRRRLGARLLTALQQQAEEPVSWLQTAADSPTRALCEWAGWRPLDAAGDPLLMVHGPR